MLNAYLLSKIDFPLVGVQTDPVCPAVIEAKNVLYSCTAIPVVLPVTARVVVDPVIESCAFNVAEPVIPTLPPVNAVTVVIEPVIGIVAEAPTNVALVLPVVAKVMVEPVIEFPICVVTLTGKVAEPVMPTLPPVNAVTAEIEPVIGIVAVALVKAVLIVDEPVIESPVVIATFNVDDPVIPTEPLTTPENGIDDPVIPTDPPVNALTVTEPLTL